MRQFGGIAAVFVALLASGCVASRRYPPAITAPSSQLIPVDPAPSDPPSPKIKLTNGQSQPRRTILAISGGGLFGAYSVGVLKGWSEVGTRPKFDIVTGVSTGALIAPLAFLGPENDLLLEKWYTSLKPSDIFERRPFRTIPWADSVADSAPLRKRVEAVVTAEFLERIACEYAAGRRLYIGTTNLDSKRIVVWDMGAIAASDDVNKLKLFQNVIIASCSIPGLLPPVPIDVEIGDQWRTELHVDGGITECAFVPPCALRNGSINDAESKSTNSEIYVLISGKVVAGTRPVKLRVLSVAGASVDGLFLMGVRADLQRIYHQAERAGAEFAFTALADDFTTGGSAVDINPKLMKDIFEEGRKFARSGLHWRRTPPGLDDMDQNLPRTGTKLMLIDHPLVVGRAKEN